MKLIVLPDDGMAPLVAAIKKAKTSIDTTIFRFDRLEVEKALEAAVGRGVRVRALIAHTNRGGEKVLRKLELRLLGAGVTVARSADDLVRYHAKFMVVDGRALFVMLFNYTALDARSRSFCVVTTARNAVAEAIRLFEADSARQPCEPAPQHLVVSPENARKRLSDFVKGARKSLWMYDPKLSDAAMIRLLEERLKKGVDIRVIGSIGKRAKQFNAAAPRKLRLHARVIIRDGRAAFFGSQSLRTAELDARREVGLIARHAALVKAVSAIFEKDWADAAGEKPDEARPEAEPEREVAMA